VIGLWEGDQEEDERVDDLSCGSLIPAVEPPESLVLYDARGTELRRQRVVGFRQRGGR